MTDDAYDPQTTTALWRIIAVGRRPTDWMRRQLLLDPLLEDGRLREFHGLCRDPPDWIRHLVQDLQRPHQAQAIQHYVADFLYRRRLNQLLELRDDAWTEQIRRAWWCPPTGYGFEWRGDDAGWRQPCHQASFCPWCYARRAIDLYQRIVAGPWQGGQGEFLVLGSVLCTDEARDRQGFLGGTAERLREVRRIGNLLLSALRSIGVDHGVTTLQMGPRLAEEIRSVGDRCFELGHSQRFEYRVAVLGVVERRISVLHQALESDSLEIRLPLQSSPGAVFPHITVLAGTASQALREMWVGASLQRKNSRFGKARRGAFWIPPWQLASSDQWREFLTAFRGMRAFSTFGDWRQANTGRRATPVSSSDNQEFSEDVSIVL